MKISTHVILCMHAGWLQTHPCLKGNVRETGHVRSPCCVVSAPPRLQVSCMVSYRVCTTSTTHSRVYKPTERPVASLQTVLWYSSADILIERIHLVCMCQSVLYPTSRQRLYFQQFSYVRTSWLQRKNRLICKGKLKLHVTCFSVCMQYGHKCIHVSRVTYERLGLLRSPC